MAAQLQDTKVTTIQDHGNKLFKEFAVATDALIGIIRDIEILRDAKSSLKQQRDVELDQIVSQIDRAQSKEEKISLLTLLSEKPWIDKEFKPQILDYRDFLMKYIKTTADKQLVDLDKALADDFKRKVGVQKNEFDRKIDEASGALQEQIEAFKAALESLVQWKKTIKSIPITSKDVTNLVATGIKFTGLPIEQFAVEAVMACLEELLTFKQRTYHLKGITSRGMQAYNRLRPDRDTSVINT
jgi:hypothetical protein